MAKEQKENNKRRELSPGKKLAIASGAALATGLGVVHCAAGQRGHNAPIVAHQPEGLPSSRFPIDLIPAEKPPDTRPPRSESFASRSERAAVTVAPEEIGILLDLKISDFAKYDLRLKAGEKDYIVEAVPADKALVERKMKAPYNSGGLVETREALEAFRNNKRSELQRDGSMVRGRTIQVPCPNNNEKVESGIPLARAKLSADKLILRVELGRAGGWFKNLITSPAELARLVDRELTPQDPCVQFVIRFMHNTDEANTTLPMLERIFVLGEEDRAALARALREKDYAKAADITHNMGQGLITQDLYAALEKYKDYTNDQPDIDLGSKQTALYVALKGISYADIPSRYGDKTPEDEAKRMLRDALGEKQYQALSGLHGSSIEILSDMLFEDGANLERINAAIAANKKPGLESDIPLLETLAGDVDWLFGRDNHSGLMARTNTHLNIAGVIQLLRYQEQLRQFLKEQEAHGLTDYLQESGGKTYFVAEMPVAPEANGVLSRLSLLMRIAQGDLPIVEPKLDPSIQPESLPARLAAFFYHEQYLGESQHFPNAHGLLGWIMEAKPPGKELASLLTQPLGKEADSGFTLTPVTAGFKDMPAYIIEGVPAKKAAQAIGR